jgi:hypothetical protein
MSYPTLVYNYETAILKIISNNNEIDTDYEHFIELLEDECYVMRINGICSSDSEFKLTTINDYYSILNEYMNEFEVTNEELETITLTYNLDKYVIQETSHFLSSDLCSFCLYKINKL